MKAYTYLTLLFGFLLLFSSCGEDEQELPDIDLTELIAPVLSVEKESVILIKEQSDAITLSWSPAIDKDIPVGYKIYINLEGKDIFSKPYIEVDAGNNLSYTFTHIELNDLLISILGAQYGKTLNLNISVSASSEGYESINSNELPLVATTFKDFPTSLILVGDALMGQWDLDQGIELTSNSHGIYEGEVEFLVGPISLNYGFKLYYPEDEAGRFLGKSETAEEFGKLEVFTSGDHKIPLAINGIKTGIYKIEINMEEMQVKLERIGDIDFVIPDEIHLIGEAVPWKWDWDNSERKVMTKQSQGIYRVEDVKLTFGDNNNPLGFKVVPLFQNYSIYYAADQSSTKEDGRAHV